MPAWIHPILIRRSTVYSCNPEWLLRFEQGDWSLHCGKSASTQAGGIVPQSSQRTRSCFETRRRLHRARWDQLLIREGSSRRLLSRILRFCGRYRGFPRGQSILSFNNLLMSGLHPRPPTSATTDSWSALRTHLLAGLIMVSRHRVASKSTRPWSCGSP